MQFYMLDARFEANDLVYTNVLGAKLQELTCSMWMLLLSD